MSSEREPGIGRRAFLRGMVGVAGMGALASCGGAGTSTVASCVSNLKFPTVATQSRPGLEPSKVANVGPAWTEYPQPYVSVPEPPGSGGTVTTFQILFSSPPPPMNNNPWWQELNKRLNVTWQPTLADSPDYAAKLLTLAASGSFPDITYINFNQNGLYNGAGFMKFISEGAFHDLTPYLTGNALKKFPNLAGLPAITWKGSSFEGKIYGCPYPIQAVNGQIGMYRKDWAQKLGVDNPKNADEVARMFLAFTHEDPNGNGGKTWGIDTPRESMWNGMFRVPNNWRLNKNGSLTKDFETPEFEAALHWARNLWAKGAFYPDALTITLNQEESLIESGKTGFFTQGGWGFFGNQPGTMYSLAKQNNPAANCAPWIPPGHDGGKPAQFLGSASYGFGAIPSTIKDEKRILELIGLMNYCSAPFGSEEFTFLYHGIEGQMYNMVNGAPVGVTNGNQNWGNGLNYLCGQGEINYFYANQPGFARTIQGIQEQEIETAVTDPTLNLYSPTWVQQGANLITLQQNAYNSILSGNKPMSYLKTAISDWKSQGGDRARKEFQQALQKCGKSTA